MDLQLIYEGGGRFRTATRLDHELTESRCVSGERVRVKVSRPRSVRQNNLFHALIEAAWENQRAGPRLPTWRHLKSWLLIKVGHCDVRELPFRAITKEAARALREAFETIDFTTDNRVIHMKIARQTRNLSAEQFGDVLTKVADLIALDIVPGTTVDQLLDEAKRRCGVSVKPTGIERQRIAV